MLFQCIDHYALNPPLTGFAFPVIKDKEMKGKDAGIIICVPKFVLYHICKLMWPSCLVFNMSLEEGGTVTSHTLPFFGLRPLLGTRSPSWLS